MSHKKCLVLGAGGFVGGHLCQRLVDEGHKVVGIDIKRHEFSSIDNPNYLFGLGDLSLYENADEAVSLADFDEVYQLAADMGGSLYIFTGENDANIMTNSSLINLNILKAAVKYGVPKIFFSSSACIYPQHNQLDPNNPVTHEASAYPADPDSDYGFEKLFSERLYFAYQRNYGIDVKVARFHNIFGPEGTYKGGREKAPAAVCRKVAEVDDGGSIELWGDGKQTRSFLYIDECIEGVLRLMDSGFSGPVNIGSEEMVTIDQLAKMAIDISGKNVSVNYIPGPTGVRGRCSENTLLRKELGWEPRQPLRVGMEKTYRWIEEKVKNESNDFRP